DQGDAQLSAISDAKGRVLALFHAWREADDWWLALAASEAEWLQAYLARFIFRSKVRIAPVPELAVAGITGTRPHTIGWPEALRPISIAPDRRIVCGESSALDDAANTLRTRTGSPVTIDPDGWKRA